MILDPETARTNEWLGVEDVTDRHIRKAAEASRRGDRWLWCAALYAADVVGTYAKHGTQAISDATARDVSQVENWAHAVWMYRELRSFGVELRTLHGFRNILTLTHFAVMWDLRQKYDISINSCYLYLREMVMYKRQGQSCSVSALRQEVEAHEDKSGHVIEWDWARKSFRTMLVKIAAMKTPERVQLLVNELLKELDTE